LRKIEIGPGENSLGSDWEAMDMVPRPHVQIVHDIRELPYPIPDSVYDLVYMSHILEHIPWFQTIDCLQEIRRILKPGGVLEVWVPDLRKLVLAYLDPRLVPFDGWYKFNSERDPVKWFNGRLFTYGPGEENWHRAAFDREYLIRCMERAGYVAPQDLKKPRGYDHGWINLGIVASKPL
jgi:ubiquinone/menaquinone biosynthesis C-methylase UbiE